MKRLSGSSVARIAGNILSSFPPEDFYKIGLDECKHEFHLAVMIAKLADDFDAARREPGSLNRVEEKP